MTTTRYTANDVRRHVEATDQRGPDECWPWTWALAHGYGKLWVGNPKRLLGAHRLAKAIADGLDEIPDRQLEIDHLCENKACQNPAHLEWVAFAGRINSVRHNLRRFGDRTHCPNGHEWNDDNVYRRGKYQACRICRTAAATAAHRRQRASA